MSYKEIWERTVPQKVRELLLSGDRENILLGYELAPDKELVACWAGAMRSVLINEGIETLDGDDWKNLKDFINGSIKKEEKYFYQAFFRKLEEYGEIHRKV